jgi:ABC-type branched-subunit amino acid transport system substrate-binding protein
VKPLWPWCAAALCCGALAQVPTPSAFPDRDSAAAARAGKAIFRNGANRHGEEVRAEAGAGVALAGTLTACARCHGADGLGRRDAGLTAPPLTWSALTQARVSGSGLVARSAYTPATLLAAIRDGLDADGRRLASAMPRFQLAGRDAADLLAYLQRIGTDADAEAGVDADVLRVATLLPLSGPRAALGEAARNAIGACVSKVNRAGGLYGRRVELLVLDSATGAPLELARRVADEALLAIAPWWGELDAGALSARLPDTPLVGPLGVAADIAGAGSNVYGIAAQLDDQARLLVDAMAQGARQAGRPAATDAPRRVALLSAPTSRDQAAARAALRQAQLHEGLTLDVWRAPAHAPGSGGDSPEAALAWLQQQDADAVLVLGTAAWLRGVAQFASTSARLRQGRVHAVFGEVGAAILDWPEPLRQTLTLSLGSARDATLNPQVFLADMAAHGAASRAPAIESLAYSASCLSMEALRRAGRGVTRERVRHALESIDRFETGVTHSLSFAPGRRKGLSGAELVRLGSPSDRDPFVTLQAWRSPLQP